MNSQILAHMLWCSNVPQSCQLVIFLHLCNGGITIKMSCRYFRIFKIIIRVPRNTYIVNAATRKKYENRFMVTHQLCNIG